MIEEGSVDGLKTLETRELFGTEGERRFGESRESDFEERRLDLESSTNDTKGSEHAGGEERSSSDVVGDRVETGGDDGENGSEEWTAAEKPSKDIETGMKDELSEGRGVVCT